MNLKIIQAGVDREAEREQLSMTQLKELGCRYIRLENPVYEDDPPLDHVFEGNKHWYVGKTKPSGTWGLTPGHYGCWLSHKQSMALGFADKGHFLICEGDCKILDITKFKTHLEEAIEVLNTTDYPIIRFETSNNLISTTYYNQVSDNIWECDQVINGHCYLVNEKSKPFFDNLFETVGWHAFDWWLVYAFQKVNQKMLCFKEELTDQFSGFSEIDKVIRNKG